MTKINNVIIIISFSIPASQYQQHQPSQSHHNLYNDVSITDDEFSALVWGLVMMVTEGVTCHIWMEHTDRQTYVRFENRWSLISTIWMKFVIVIIFVVEHQSWWQWLVIVKKKDTKQRNNNGTSSFTMESLGYLWV